MLIFMFSAKSVLHLSAAEPQKPSGPALSSSFSYVRLSYTEGGQKEVRKKII